MGFSTFQWRSKHLMMKFALFTCLAAVAMADPEPWTVYGGYGGYAAGYPSTYGYGFPSTYGYGLRHYGYSRFGYGKREADAEPYLTYGAYSHGYYPRTYARYGYGYPAYTSYGYGYHG